MEVLIATGILGSALIALLSTVSHCGFMERRSVALLHQSNLARNKMNELLENKDLGKGDTVSGSFESTPYFTWQCNVAQVTLPFDEDAIVEGKSKLLKLSLRVNDSRFKKTLTLLEYRSQEM